MSLTVVILAYNEERHLRRAIESVRDISHHIIVVDSGSTDRTIEIALEMGAQCVSNPWTNHATQFNWALDNLPADTGWVFRLDADEIVSVELSDEIRRRLPLLPANVGGVSICRKMYFLGQPVRWGGLFPVRVVRLFRYGMGRCENRWMDEHIVVSGVIAELQGEIVDNNLNSVTWWIEKHNAYASREAVELLNLDYRFMAQDMLPALRSGKQASVKRWLKENVYARLPTGLRAFAYLFYRYVLRLGFLDGREGAAFHILQGFWYRYLVDIKIHEVRSFMETQNANVLTAIKEVLGIDVQPKK